MISRRHFSRTISLTALLMTHRPCAADSTLAQKLVHPDADFSQALQSLEQTAQCRLGVAVIHTENGQSWGNRQHERFMMLSSCKFLLAAYVLYRVDQGDDSLTQPVRFNSDDLLGWSPVTEQHVATGVMTLGELSEATITTSDNAAANLIMANIGGPAAVTTFLRGIGDATTRLDRYEPDLNIEAADPQLDTTTPAAMAMTMQKLLFGNILSVASQVQLQQWLVANTTGDNRLRAGLPGDWRVGDKTGTREDAANDIAVVWPGSRPPWIVAAYLDECAEKTQNKDAIIATVGTLVQDLIAADSLRK